MDWNLLAIAALLTMSGVYMLEGTLKRAPIQDGQAQVLRPARTALERAWQAEPIQVFMRQLLMARHRKASHWQWESGQS